MFVQVSLSQMIFFPLWYHTCGVEVQCIKVFLWQQSALHSEAWTKCLTFADNISKCTFLQEDVCILIEICSQWFIWWYISIATGNGLTPYRRQAIAWTNAVQSVWRNMASLGRHESKWCQKCGIDPALLLWCSGSKGKLWIDEMWKIHSMCLLVIQQMPLISVMKYWTSVTESIAKRHGRSVLRN